MATPITSVPCLTLTRIDGTDCIGDSRQIINNNITQIGQTLCTLTGNTIFTFNSDTVSHNFNTTTRTLSSNVRDNSITANKLATDSVTTAKLSAQVVTTDKIALSAIGAAQLSAQAVTQEKLALNVAGTGPAFSAYASAATALGAGVGTPVNFQAIYFNVGNCYNPSTSRFTPNVPGYYLITASVRADITSNAALHTYIYKNSTYVSVGGFINLASSQAASAASTIVYLNGTTDYCEIRAYSGTVGNTFFNTDGNAQTTFTGCLLRSA